MCLCLSSILVAAQVIDSKIFTPEKRSIITKDIQFYRNTKDLTINEIMQPSLQQQFRLLPNQSVIFWGYDPYYYWFRFVIGNTDSFQKKLVLLMGPCGMRDAVLYQKINGFWTIVSRTGNQYPFKERPYLYTHDVLPVNVQAATTDTFYLKIDEWGNFKTFSFALLHPKALKLIENRVYFTFGILTGILLLFALLNVYLFISLKEKIHLWYSIYICLLMFLLLKNEALDEQFLHLDSEPGYRLTPIMGIGALAIAVLMQVVQMFLINIQSKSILYKITSVVKHMLFVFAIAHFAVFYLRPGYKIEGFMFQLADKTTIAGVLIILINCIYSVAKGSKPAIFTLVGISVFLIGSLERLLTLSTATFLFPPSIFQTGMIIETVIISFGLMYRYNTFKKEKEMLTIQLEKQSSEAAKQIVQTLEMERKRIAEDLHDELGGNLAALKMTIQSFAFKKEQSELLTTLIDEASTNTRNIAHNLMPPEFSETKLEDLLSDYFQQADKESNIRFNFHHSGDNSHFSKEEDLSIYRIIMELSNNIIRHSKATEATVQLIYHTDQLAIMAEDNGKGFSESPVNDGIGLKNIKSRVTYMGGVINIDSGKSGSTITIHIPFIKTI